MWHNELNQEITSFEKHVFDVLGELRERVHHIQIRINEMSLDFTKINAALAQNATDTAALIALAQKLISGQSNPADQATLDALAGSVGTSNTAIETELAAANPAPPAGVTGATGA